MGNPNNHSKTDQLLHDIYLGNPSLAEISFDIESMMFPNTAPPIENVFITGLARSGTTTVFNFIYNSNEFASLLYTDMPFLLMPNLWSRIHKKKSNEKAERFHGDNILVGNDSPEALDEFFWKVFLKNKYITKDTLAINNIPNEILSKYEKYISLICHARKKTKYISKNNNSILRLPYLLKLNQPTKIIVLFRNPLEQASSLLKLHSRFSELQKDDKFILRYFNYIGHHEFGLNQKPFQLDPEKLISNASTEKDTLNFWLKGWINYYSYIMEKHVDQIIPIAFEDICSNPSNTYAYIKHELNIESKYNIPDIYVAPLYKYANDFSMKLAEEAMDIYAELSKKRKYL
jgi:hypothetical protein